MSGILALERQMRKRENLRPAQPTGQHELHIENLSQKIKKKKAGHSGPRL